MKWPNKSQLLEAIPLWSDKKVLILGDVGLDEYVMGDVRRISPEAPVPVLDVEKEDHRLGLAGNVAQNVKSMGGEPIIISVIGQDLGAEILVDLFNRNQVKTQWLISDDSRPTTRKMRVMAKHHHICRVDFETRRYVSKETQDKVFDRTQGLVDEIDIIIVEDYAKGVISAELIQRVIALGRKAGKKVLVDPHVSNHGEFYKGVDLIKPNFNEAVALSGLNYDDLRDHPNKIIEVLKTLQQKTHVKEIVMTRGRDGMTIFSNEQLIQVPTFAKQVFDVTGAGDTVIASLALSVASGLPLLESCILSNYAAGVVVGQIGCVPCTVEELCTYISESFFGELTSEFDTTTYEQTNRGPST